MSLSTKSCKGCGSEWHSYFKCPYRKRKGLRKEAVKTREQRLETTAEWDAANPPNKNGNWYCYISKHPLCPRVLTTETLVREHDKSKARSPKDKHNIKNIYPACAFDNKAKGSMSAEEYMAS